MGGGSSGKLLRDGGLFKLEEGRLAGSTPAGKKKKADARVGLIDYGDAGRESIRRFLRRGHEMGVVPSLPDLEFVE